MRKIDVEETLFKTVADEIRHGHISEGLWLKANVDASGDDQQAKLLYTKYRVSQLADDIEDSANMQQKEKKNKTVREFKKFCWYYFPFTVIALFISLLLLSGALSHAR